MQLKYKKRFGFSDIEIDNDQKYVSNKKKRHQIGFPLSIFKKRYSINPKPKNINETKFYIYGLLFSNEKEKKIFYIGKGTNDRWRAHFRRAVNARRFDKNGIRLRHRFIDICRQKNIKIGYIKLISGISKTLSSKFEKRFINDDHLYHYLLNEARDTRQVQRFRIFLGKCHSFD